MRQRPTPSESHLWGFLKKDRLGVTFRRQHAIGPYIVDLYCPQAQLIVEVDGPYHTTILEADAIRQRALESLGMRVVRFTNTQVLEHTDAVLAEIAAALTGSVGPAG